MKYVENSVESVKKSLIKAFFYLWKERKAGFFRQNGKYYRYRRLNTLYEVYGWRPVSHHTARSIASRELPQSAPSPLLR